MRNELLEARAKRPWLPGSKELNGGINLVGYFRAVKGLSNAARNSALALDAVEIPYTIIDYELGIPVTQRIEALPVSPHGQSFNF